MGKGKSKDKASKAAKGGDDFGAAAPSTSTFDGERWDKEDDLGELIAFVNIDSAEVETQHGDATAAEVDYIVILTGDNEGKVYEDQLVFGAALAPSIYGADAPSGIVLGRLEQGEGSKGKNPPWLLTEPSKKDHKVQLEWFNENATRKRSGAIKIDVDELQF